MNILLLARQPHVLAEIKTGEGKSLILAILAAYLALSGWEHVHLITSSPDLARRDALSFQLFFAKLKLTTGAICGKHHTPGILKQATISYGCSEDYLFNDLVLIQQKKSPVKRERIALIMDEVDTSLEKAPDAFRYAVQDPKAKEKTEALQTALKTYQACVMAEGLPKAEQTSRKAALKALNEKLLERPYSNQEQHDLFAKACDDSMLSWLTTPPPTPQDDRLFLLALFFDELEIAHQLGRNQQYIVTEDKGVVIVDQPHTGAMLEGMRWDGNIHTLVEMIVGLPPRESQLISLSTYLADLCKQYGALYGVTGTLGETEEIEHLKRLLGHPDFFHYYSPRQRPSDVTIYDLPEAADNKTHMQKIIKLAIELAALPGVLHPVVIMVDTIENAAQLHTQLCGYLAMEVPALTTALGWTDRGDIIMPKCQIYDGQDKSSEKKVEAAGTPGMITVGTHAIARGTDIRSNKPVCVIMTERLAPRDQEQGEGRTGRQGATGIVYHLYLAGTKAPQYFSAEYFELSFEISTVFAAIRNTIIHLNQLSISLMSDRGWTALYTKWSLSKVTGKELSTMIANDLLNELTDTSPDERYNASLLFLHYYEDPTRKPPEPSTALKSKYVVYQNREPYLPPQEGFTFSYRCPPTTTAAISKPPQDTSDTPRATATAMLPAVSTASRYDPGYTSALTEACRLGNLEMLKEQLAIMEYPPGSEAVVLVGLACSSGSIPLIAFLFNKWGRKFPYEAYRLETALFEVAASACDVTQEEFVKACHSGNIDDVNSLLTKGAGIWIRYAEGCKAGDDSLTNKKPNCFIPLYSRGLYYPLKEKTPLLAACESGNIELVRLLLELGGWMFINAFMAEESAPAYPITALLVACRSNNLELVELLLEYRAVWAASFSNTRQASPLIEACRAGNLEMLKVLIASAEIYYNHHIPSFISEWDFKEMAEKACRSGSIPLMTFLVKKWPTTFIDDSIVLANALAAAGDMTIVPREDFIAACHSGKIDHVNSLLTKGAAMWMEQAPSYYNEAPPPGFGSDKETEFKTPLFAACESGNIELVRLLLELGGGHLINIAISPRGSNKYHVTALSVACQLGNRELVKLLLEYGAGRSVTEGILSWPLNMHPLRVICRSGNLDIMKLVLESAHKLYYAYYQYWNDDHLLRKNIQLFVVEACRSGSMDLVAFLLEKRYLQNLKDYFYALAPYFRDQIYKDHIYKDDINAENLLSIPCSLGNLELVRYLFDTFQKHTRDSNGVVALLDDLKSIPHPFLEACRLGHLELVEFLLSKSRYITNHLGYINETPLLAACRSGNLKIVQILLEKGAASTVVKSDSKGETPIKLTCCLGNLDMLKVLLENIETLRPGPNGKFFPDLFIAVCRSGHVHLVEYLFDTYSVNALELLNNLESVPHPFLEACRLGHLELVEFLLSKSRYITNHLGYINETPLLAACRSGNLKIVQILLEKGVETSSISKRNSKGESPIRVACQQNNVDVLKVLLENSLETTTGKIQAPVVDELLSVVYELECYRLLHVLVNFNDIRPRSDILIKRFQDHSRLGQIIAELDKLPALKAKMKIEIQHAPKVAAGAGTPGATAGEGATRTSAFVFSGAGAGARARADAGAGAGARADAGAGARADAGADQASGPGS